MKKLILFLALASSVFAVNVNVQKDSVTQDLTGNLSVPSSLALTVKSGGSLVVASGGTATFPANSIAWSALTGKPTTIAGYGITDPLVYTSGSYADPSWITSLLATKLTGTIAAGRLPAFTGDATSTVGTSALTLATVAAGGTVGSGTQVPVVTFNTKGLVTGVTTTAPTPAWSNVTGTPSSASGYGIANGAAIDALGAVAANGALTRTAANTYVARTLTGTAAELTVTNGDGVAGNPTVSLPSALTFTGKTVTGGTFTSPTLTTPTIGDGTAAAPSLTFTSDTNTGLYRPAADTVGIAGGGNDVVRLTGVASALDYLEIKNGTGIGAPLHLLASGTSANIGVHLQPKGTGLFTISDGTDFNKGIRFRSSSSAASAVTLIDAVSTAGRVITLPDITGTLATLAGTEALSNKTITASAFNGTVGATTPSTGAFTTLYQGASGAQGLNVGFSGAAGQGFTLRDTTNSRTYFITTETATGLQINSGANPITLVGNTNVTGALSATGSITTTAGSFFGVAGTYNLSAGAEGLVFGSATAAILRAPAGTSSLRVGNTDIVSASSSGAAVTGALSATGILSGPGFRASKTTASSGLVKIQDEGANTYNVIASRNNADSAALPLDFQATNFAFNGAVDVRGNLTAGVSGTGTNILIKEYSAGAQRNWAIRDDFGIDRLRFSRGSSDQVFWDVLKVAASDQTGNQIWYTHGAERMQLSSTGLAVTGQIGNSFTGANGQYALSSDNTSSANFHVFYNSASVAIGSINRVTTTNAVSYNTTSDRRIKENFGLLTDSGRLIDLLTPRTFDRKDGTDDDRKGWLGFVAQEVHAADPVFARIGFVTVGDDDPTEVTKTWGVSSSPIDALLVAELKSLRARVAQLEAQNESLDARMAAVEKLLKK
jgi:hypothetical protein